MFSVRETLYAEAKAKNLLIPLDRINHPSSSPLRENEYVPNLPAHDDNVTSDGAAALAAGSPLTRKEINDALEFMNEKGYYLEKFYGGFKEGLNKKARRFNFNGESFKAAIKVVIRLAQYIRADRIEEYFYTYAPAAMEACKGDIKVLRKMIKRKEYYIDPCTKPVGRPKGKTCYPNEEEWKKIIIESGGYGLRIKAGLEKGYGLDRSTQTIAKRISGNVVLREFVREIRKKRKPQPHKQVDEEKKERGSSPLGKDREIESSLLLQEFNFSSSIILDTSSSPIDPMSIEWDDVKSWVKKIKKEAKAYNHNLVSFEYELSLSIAPLEIKTLINAKNLAQFENYLRDNIAKDEVPFRNDYGKKDIKQLISGIDFSRYEGDNIKTYRRFVSNAFYDCIMYLKKHYQWSFQFVMNQIESISFNENHFFGVNKRAKLYFGVKDIGDSIWKKEILQIMERILRCGLDY